MIVCVVGVQMPKRGVLSLLNASSLYGHCLRVFRELALNLAYPLNQEVDNVPVLFLR